MPLPLRAREPSHPRGLLAFDERPSLVLGDGLISIEASLGSDLLAHAANLLGPHVWHLGPVLEVGIALFVEPVS